MGRSLVVSLAVLLGATYVPSASGAAAEPVGPTSSASVPVDLDHNRTVVEVDIVAPGGDVRTARAWVDTGNQYLIVTEALARELGLQVPDADTSGHAVLSPSPAPAVHLGAFPLPVTGVQVLVRASRTVHEGVDAELNLPASMLRGLHVVLDYPGRRMTVARPGVLTPRGAEVPCLVNPDTGLFQVTAVVDGAPVPFGVDNGSAGTWVSTDLTRTWLEKHPDWRHVVGAVGSANFWGLPLETGGELMRLAHVTIGPVDVANVGVLGLNQGLFDWYSKKTPAAVAGFIGANVLTRYRLEIDFPAATTWWEPGPGPIAEDFDIVPVTVRAEPDGGFTVAGVVHRDGRPAVAGLQPGARLVRIGDLDVTGSRMGAVVDALRGRPGERRMLVVERGGNRLTVEARVERLP